MDFATKIQVARVDAGLSATDVARIAGVPTSTVTRLEKGASASMSTLGKVLDAVGMKVDLAVSSRPSAIIAARWIFGDDVKAPSDLEYWLGRWSRAGWLDAEASTISNPASLLADAGKMASLRSRPGTVNVSYADFDKTADKLNKAGIEYAATGDYAGSRYTSYVTESWPVFYVDDTTSAVEAIGEAQLPEGRWGKRVSLIPFDGASESGRKTDETGPYEGITFVSPWQMLMDNYAGAGRMPLRAEKILRIWEAENVEA